MAQIDPKWIQYDGDTLTIIDDAGTNRLAINIDSAGALVVTANGLDVDLQTLVDNNAEVLITDLNAELLNGSKGEVRTTSEGAPAEDAGRDQTKDFYIEVPD